jgi:hypothetical protein
MAGVREIARPDKAHRPVLSTIRGRRKKVPQAARLCFSGHQFVAPMAQKRPRVIGTTENAIMRAETASGRAFPPSFRTWLLTNNGLGLEGVSIFPVLDDRDPRKTWDSIVREFQNGWTAWLSNFGDENRDFSHLLPFGDFGTGDYYCFDYTRVNSEGEAAVVRWSHETRETEDRAESFLEFTSKLQTGAFACD